MDKITRTAKRMCCKLKHQIDIPRVTRYLETFGYAVVYFKTDYGDTMLYDYGIVPGDKKSFIYCAKIKVVFVDGTLHTEDRLHLLLHECGHIVLGHIGHGNIGDYNRYLLESEAETFAHSVLQHRYEKRSRFWFYTGIVSIIALILCITLWVFVYNEKRSAANNETVYVTATGSKYHRISCISIKGKNYIALTKQTAVKIYEPCKLCNP